MRLIFLDFDGPIIPRMCHVPVRRAEKEKAWPACVAALNRITDSTGAKIVVSSMWRYDGIMKTKRRLKDWGVTAKMIGVTPHIDTMTAGGIFPAVTRGMEIAKFMADYRKEEIESFVILDDDDDMDHLMPFLILTPFDVGLTEADADKAIEMLNTKREIVC